MGRFREPEKVARHRSARCAQHDHADALNYRPSRGGPVVRACSPALCDQGSPQVMRRCGITSGAGSPGRRQGRRMPIRPHRSGSASARAASDFTSARASSCPKRRVSSRVAECWPRTRIVRSGDWRDLEPGRCDLVLSVLYDRIIGSALIDATETIIALTARPSPAAAMTTPFVCGTSPPGPLLPSPGTPPRCFRLRSAPLARPLPAAASTAPSGRGMSLPGQVPPPSPAPPVCYRLRSVPMARPSPAAASTTLSGCGTSPPDPAPPPLRRCRRDFGCVQSLRQTLASGDDKTRRPGSSPAPLRVLPDNAARRCTITPRQEPTQQVDRREGLRTAAPRPSLALQRGHCTSPTWTANGSRRSLSRTVTRASVHTRVPEQGALPQLPTALWAGGLAARTRWLGRPHREPGLVIGTWHMPENSSSAGMARHQCALQ